MSTILCGTGRTGAKLLPEDLANDTWCCYGSAEDGPTACTCWRPVFDREQQRADPNEPVPDNIQKCGDCAYRPDSPERQADEDFVESSREAVVFYCHRGMRRAIAYVHPDGRRREPVDAGDYQPLVVNAVAYRADGRPAARCAGWIEAVRGSAAE